jgi:phosphatidylglycerophosphate synthase
MAQVNPDTLSWASFGAAAAAGVAIYLGGGQALLAALGLLFVSALLDALDGRVAKLSGRASRRGDFLDHTLDRYSDLFILGGILFSAYVPLALGLLALLGVLMTSYMGTQAQALGLGRIYGGLMGRADRLMVLILAVAIQAALDPSGASPLGYGVVALTPLGWAMAAFAVLGHVTAVQRGLWAWRALSRQG